MQVPFRALAGALAVMAGVAIGGAAHAQPAPVAQDVVGLEVDSGLVVNDGRARQAIWAEVVDVPGASWLRLDVDELVLGAAPADGEPTVLRVTGLLDGHRQHLDEVNAARWQLTTAYFNGSAVLVELVADPGAAPSRVSLAGAWAGAPADASISTICGSDDRVLSNDARVARVMPIGCTAFMIDDPNRTFLSARHCYGSSSFTVCQFNVPLSTGGGDYVHPGPEDQYPVDAASVQLSALPTLGDDWVYFGCFPNTETGLTPYQAQGVHYELAFEPPAASGNVRITGHGTVEAPVPPQWNGVQTTHAGAYLDVLDGGGVLEYQADTTGGNSGSAVLHEDSGLAIGIHTNGGCGGGQGNFGMSLQNSGLLAALAAPKGVCVPVPRLLFEYEGGTPDFLSPAGELVRLDVIGTNGWEHESDSGTFFLDAGEGWTAHPMTSTGPDAYEVQLPPLECGVNVRWYVVAETTLGDDARDPITAPASWYTGRVAEGVLETLFSDDFELPNGWTVEGDALDGQWERAVPAGGGDRGDPPTDFDGSGLCFVTDNEDGNSDVDLGATILTSPSLGAPVPGAYLTYARWYDNADNGQAPDDVMVIEVSPDGGTSWFVLETIGPEGDDSVGGWRPVSFLVDDLNDLVGADDVRLRVTVSDTGTGSVVEAGLDAVELVVIDCEGIEVEPTDINGDGITGFLDLVELLALWGPCPGDPGCPGDVTLDGIVGFLDLVELLAAWD